MSNLLTDKEIYKEIDKILPKTRGWIARRSHQRWVHVVIKKTSNGSIGSVSGPDIRFNFEATKKLSKSYGIKISPKSKVHNATQCREFLIKAITKIMKENEGLKQGSGKGFKVLIGKGFSVRCQDRFPHEKRIDRAESDKNFSLAKAMHYYHEDFIKMAKAVDARCFFKS